jgi:hypothetical protein
MEVEVEVEVEVEARIIYIRSDDHFGVSTLKKREQKVYYSVL